MRHNRLSIFWLLAFSIGYFLLIPHATGAEQTFQSQEGRVLLYGQTGRPKMISIPLFSQKMIFRWLIQVDIADYDLLSLLKRPRWVKGKITEEATKYDSRNSYLLITAYWEGGQIIEIPDGHWSVIQVEVYQASGELIWRFKWVQP